MANDPNKLDDFEKWLRWRYVRATPSLLQQLFPGNHVTILSRRDPPVTLTAEQATKLAAHVLRMAGYEGTAGLMEEAFVEEERRLSEAAQREDNRDA